MMSTQALAVWRRPTSCEYIVTTTGICEKDETGWPPLIGLHWTCFCCPRRAPFSAAYIIFDGFSFNGMVLREPVTPTSTPPRVMGSSAEHPLLATLKFCSNKATSGDPFRGHSSAWKLHLEHRSLIWTKAVSTIPPVFLFRS